MQAPALSRRAKAGARRATRAFTLLELMVVVILIGLLTVLAIPTMAEGRYNARTMDDATQVAELYREARTRAMGRGAAMLITGTSTNTVGGTDLGTFQLYEAQIWGTGIATTALPLPGGSPVSSCGPPIAAYWATVTNATNSPASLMDHVNLNGSMEAAAQIYSTITDGTAAVQAQTSMCYTPLGRAYYASGTLTPTFTPGVGVLHGEIQIAVQRSGVSGGGTTGITRTVIIPDSGSTRIISR